MRRRASRSPSRLSAGGAPGRTSVGVASAYRDYAYDEALWNRYYPKYYDGTANDRSSAPGGAHGSAAARILAAHIAQWKAAPGFSNHSNGTAVDFTTPEGGVKFGADSEQRVAWRATWFHRWLVQHAGEHGFLPLATEEWHWDFKR